MTTRCNITAALVAVLATAVVAAPAHGAGTGTAPKAYGKQCQGQSKKRVPGVKGTPFSKCVTAMARLAGARSRSPHMACATMSRKRTARARTSSFGKCVAAGNRLIKHGNGIDLAYVEMMIPHHLSAIQMAEFALTRAQTPFLQALVQNIIKSQNAELTRMRKIAARLRARGIEPVSLGLTEAEMGMNHDMSHLFNADPFDIVFVDMMIPHHQGAITMSEVVLKKGVSREVRRLAEQIMADQMGEIEQMREFRASVTGSTGPAPGGSGGGGGHH